MSLLARSFLPRSARTWCAQLSRPHHRTSSSLPSVPPPTLSSASSISTPDIKTNEKVVKEPLSKLALHLQQSIKISGPMSVATFMRQALTHPLGGYYMQKDVFGRQGDFITSPEISQLFGEMVGIWWVSHWTAIGSPSQIRLVELGPGRGTLMADMIRTISQFKSFQSAVSSITFVEASPHLKTLQKAAIDGVDFKGTVSWVDSVEDLPPGPPTFIMAHEFFDAMPVYQFEKRKEGWREIVVDIDGSSSSPYNFRFITSPTPTKATATLLSPSHAKRYQGFEQGARIEVAPDNFTIAKSMGHVLKRDGGVGLVVDYGKFCVMGDTLRGIHKHEFRSPLSLPGECDVTADVDFTLLRDAFVDAGCYSHGPITQSQFLTQMGILQRLQSLLSSTQDKELRKELIQGCRRLVEDAAGRGMGGVYKFMCVCPEKEADGSVPYPFHL